MINLHPFLKFFLIFICLSLSKSICAIEVNPYLFIQYEDNKILDLKLSKDFSIEPQSGILKISDSSLESPLTMPLNTISFMGFIYKETETDDASIDSIIDNNVNALWEIYDIEGKLIRETNSKIPDLKNLPAGKIFIIKNGSSSYKYIPYK